MAKHEKNKAGLQKEISSIFKGVSIPQKGGEQEPSGTPAPERTDYTEPKQPAPEPQKSEVPKAYQAAQTLTKDAQEQTDYTEPKQPTPQPQKTQDQKPYQVKPSLPKAAPAEKPKAEPVQKSKAEPAHLPEFVTAQQSDVEPAQRPKAEPEQKPKVEQAQQPKAEQVQKPKVEPAKQPKAEFVQKSKVEPARQPKADIDKKVSKKRPIVKISSQSFWQQIKNKMFAPKPGAGNTKQKAMVVMMPLLFIVLIFMLLRGGVFGTSAGQTETSTEDPAGVAAAGANTKIDWEIPAPYPTTLRDPMRLVPVEIPQTDEQAETGKTTELIVKSILYSEDNPSAVVSGRIIHEGEKIRGVSVIKISEDSVEFEMNGKRWTQKVQ